MTIATQYDWIVLGDHPAALLSANLVARLGLSVLVVPRCSSMRLTHSSEDQRVLDPESNFLLGVAPDGLLHDCLEKSGVDIQSALLPESLPQALTPRNRIQFQSNRGLLKQEIDRELPSHHKKSQKAASPPAEASFLLEALDQSRELLDHWHRFPNQLTLETVATKKKAPKRVSWQEVLKKTAPMKLSEEIQASPLLEALRFGFTGQTPKGEAPILETLHALALGQTGSAIRGGMSAYRELLLRNAKRLGMTVLENGECKRIFVENGRFIGVQLSASGNMIGGTGCALGSSFDEFSSRVSMNGRNWFSLNRQWPDPTGWKFTIAISVGEEAIPPGASTRMVWKEPEAPVVEIEVLNASDYGDRDRTKKLVFLRTVLPYSSDSLNSETQKLIAARMFRLATQFMPYLEYHVNKIYPDFRVEDLKTVYPFRKLEEIPENLKCYGERSGLGHLLKGSGSGIEGLFISSNQSFPELGSLGPTVAAIESVAWIAHRMGLPGPLA